MSNAPRGQRTERYQWLVPIGARSKAHAFVPGAKHSLCLDKAALPVGGLGWEREAVGPGEPRRIRCTACSNIITGNPDMAEVQA